MRHYLALICLAVGILGLGYGTSQAQFPAILTWFGLSFIGYFLLIEGPTPRWSFTTYQWIAIGLRVLLLFGLPLLSDDLYRFIWDGRLLAQGINPFDHLPAEYAAQGFPIPGLNEELYLALNSPSYFTIYPPVAQGLFYVGAKFFPANLWANSVFLKTCLLLFEVGTIFLLPKLLSAWRLPERQALWYILNPLIIVELVGNLHFEAAMIFFLAAALWLLTQHRLPGAALLWALSIASKLLTLLFLPLFLRRWPWRRWFYFYAIVGISTILLFLPLLNGVFFANFGDSLGLYFQKFEFNASIYFLLRALISPLLGYNPIQFLGPALGLATLLGVICLVVKEKESDWPSFPHTALWAFCLYLLFATTVHPWYLAIPIFLAACTGKKFPLVWSALIILTYIKYSDWEMLYYAAVALEYLAVLAYFLFRSEWKSERLTAPT